MEELVSVVIPIYNAETYLKKCINSIIRQTYKNIEIITVNDGSKDSSLLILQDYQKKDKRIKIIDKENEGVSRTRNRGIEEAKGNFIVFVDSDDYVEKDLIEILMKNRNQKAFHICTYFRETMKKNGVKIEEVLYEDKQDQMFKNKDFLNLYKAGLMNSPYCKLYERDILIKNNIRFNPNISLGEDLIFNLTYLKYVTDIKYTNKALYHYIKRENESLSTKYISNMLEVQKTIYYHLSDFCYQNLENNEEELKEIHQIGLYCMLTAVSNEYKNRKINIFKRYINSKKILEDEELKNHIKEMQSKNEINNLQAKQLLKKRYLCYRIIRKG